MTREVIEAIEYIKTYRKLDENLHNTAPKGSVSFSATEKCLNYWDMAIKALEQEPILDKIRAEIEQEIAYKPMEMWDYRMGLKKALDIIDKCKAESEERNESVEV